jgi:C4-dicarboxylate transporter DctM subunit
MTVLNPLGRASGERANLFDHLEQWFKAATGSLAALGVLGMLVAAAATVIDVTLRWAFDSGVVALNEILSMAFAVAIAACIPAGLANGVNLKIDIFSRWITGRLAAWLDAFGACTLLLFFLLLAWHITLYANSLVAQGRTTMILGWPLAPFIYSVAALLALGSLVQTVVTINAIRRAWNYSEPGTGSSSSPVASGIAMLLGAIVIAIAVYAAADFPAISRWAVENPGQAVILLFVIMWILILGLVPVAALTGLLGVVGAALFIGIPPAFSAFATETTGLITNSQVATLPLFLMMGSFAAVSGIADDLYKLAHILFGRFRGGLGLATIGSCAGFGAMTGSSLATAATVGRVAIPEMRERGYSPALATGVCAAGGTLGPLVPPSGAIIVFALLTESSIGQLFMAAVGAAALSVLLYFVTVMLYVRIAPKSTPPASGSVDWAELRAVLARCLPIALLIFGVIGGLYLGVFTDTESAAFGAIGAFAIAIFRGKLNRHTFLNVMVETTATTAMVYGIIIGAQMFAFLVGVSSLTEAVTTLVANLHWQPQAVIAIILIGYLLLGVMMESFAVMIITVPFITPVVNSLGFDTIWWGIVMVCVVETGMIHPPFGINVVVLKGITPDISLWTIYRGVTPFVVADLVKLVLLVLFPMIALWLPYTMMR